MKRSPLLRTVARSIDRTLGADAEGETAIEGLHFARSSAPTRPVHAAQWPCLTIVVQGQKTLTLGEDTYRYGPGDFVLVALDVPTESRVVRASATEPYLGLAVEIDPVRLNELLARTPIEPSRAAHADVKAVSVARLPDDLLDAVHRLVALLDHPQDIAAMAPLIEQEILYRLLTTSEGWRLVRIATEDSPANRIARAIAWLRKNFRRGLLVAEMAHAVGMSESSLHQHFKSVTGLTPIKYQRHLRLMEARRLLMIDHLDVGTAGYEVGYQSPSQFSRDYKRHYGASPRDHLQ